jgi:hypothetical protein
MASPQTFGDYRDTRRGTISGDKKRSPFELKNKMRREHDIRLKEKRYDLLLNSFRHISITGDDSDVVWDTSYGDKSPEAAALSPVLHNGGGDVFEEDDVMNSSDNADDWGEVSAEVIPKLDLRTINFMMQGLPCPYCKESVLALVTISGKTNELKCSCGFELKSCLNLAVMQSNLQNIVNQHASTCLSGNSPNYGMFGPKAMVSCDTCGLNTTIN